MMKAAKNVEEATQHLALLDAKVAESVSHAKEADAQAETAAKAAEQAKQNLAAAKDAEAKADAVHKAASEMPCEGPQQDVCTAVLANTKAKLALYNEAVEVTAQAVKASDAAALAATNARASAAAAVGHVQAARATAAASQAALERANALLNSLNRSVYKEEAKMTRKRAVRPTATVAPAATESATTTASA